MPGSSGGNGCQQAGFTGADVYAATGAAIGVPGYGWYALQGHPNEDWCYGIILGSAGAAGLDLAHVTFTSTSTGGVYDILSTSSSAEASTLQSAISAQLATEDDGSPTSWCMHLGMTAGTGMNTCGVDNAAGSADPLGPPKLD